MNTEIRELKSSDVEAAVAFCHDAGDAEDPVRDADGLLRHLRRHPGLSLIAEADATTRAVLLTTMTSDGGPSSRLVVGEAADESLVRTMLDKAALKLYARGMAACRIVCAAAGHDDWLAMSRWDPTINETSAPDEPTTVAQESARLGEPEAR